MLDHLKCYFGRSLALFVEKKILVLVCEDFGLIGINYDSIQEIKFNYGKLGRHVAKKKNSRPMQSKKKKNSNLKNPKSAIEEKKKN